MYSCKYSYSFLHRNNVLPFYCAFPECHPFNRCFHSHIIWHLPCMSLYPIRYAFRALWIMNNTKIGNKKKYILNSLALIEWNNVFTVYSSFVFSIISHLAVLYVHIIRLLSQTDSYIYWFSLQFKGFFLSTAWIRYFVIKKSTEIALSPSLATATQFNSYYLNIRF